MNCSKGFIVAYNEMFKYVKEHGNSGDVLRFWELLSDLLCQKLVFLAKTKGIPGLVEYWTETLTEENADCELCYQTNNGKPILTIEMLQCPSRRTISEVGAEIYPNYCGHCQVMYAKALSPLGIMFRCDSENDGRCFIRVETE